MEISSKQFAAIVTGDWRGLDAIDLGYTLALCADVPDFAVADVKGLSERIDAGPTQWCLRAVDSAVGFYLGLHDRNEALIEGRKSLRPELYPAGTVLRSNVYPYGLSPALYPDGVVEVEAGADEKAEV